MEVVDNNASMEPLKAAKNALYKHCASLPPDTTFTQEDLLGTKLVPENSLLNLLQITQDLAKNGEFKIMTRGNQTLWRCVSNATQTMYRGLDPEAALIFSHIETAGREGMLASTLNRRTNFHKATMDKCIKVLEQKRLIKTVPNYRHPKRKTFMLWGLQPAEDVTGGPFYSGGELDEDFVAILCWMIERFVVSRSWWFPPVSQTKGSKKRKVKAEDDGEGVVTAPSAEDTEGEKKPALNDAGNAVEERASVSNSGRQRSRHMRPFPPSYRAYPTISQITNAINTSGSAKVTLKISDVQQLVDILCWDNKLERTPRHSVNVHAQDTYRAVKVPLVDSEASMSGAGIISRGKLNKDATNGLTEAPCGQCPVFDVCEEGGLVSPQTCPYFEQWLSI